MGWGDELMGSGMARDAATRGKRAAIGDGEQVIWTKEAFEIYRNNPNVVKPGEEDHADAGLEWIKHCVGKRAYHVSLERRQWRFNRSFRATPGEIFFDRLEMGTASGFPSGFVIVEPTVKQNATNKQWPRERYQRAVDLLAAAGYRVAQFASAGLALDRTEQLRPGSFRLAAAVLQRSALYLGPEGGLHHAAAAVGTKAVVIFGGFISPAVTGYAGHENIFTGSELGCGHLDPCSCCREAMKKIEVEEVVEKSLRLLAS